MAIDPDLSLLAIGPLDEWRLYLDGYQAGYVDGIERGREIADDEAAAIHREAVRVVHAMAKLDPHVDREERRRRCQADAAERHALDARSWDREAS